MPLMRCGDNSQGWKYGESGKCFESKKDAIRQGLAIQYSEKRAGKRPEGFGKSSISKLIDEVAKHFENQKEDGEHEN
jgi:hypothetical protein